MFYVHAPNSEHIPSMPYYTIQIPIGWNGLSIPTEGCSLCVPNAIINFKVRGVK